MNILDASHSSQAALEAFQTGAKLLKRRFRLGHAARNLPILTGCICQSVSYNLNIVIRPFSDEKGSLKVKMSMHSFRKKENEYAFKNIDKKYR